MAVPEVQDITGFPVSGFGFRSGYWFGDYTGIMAC